MSLNRIKKQINDPITETIVSVNIFKFISLTHFEEYIVYEDYNIYGKRLLIKSNNKYYIYHHNKYKLIDELKLCVLFNEKYFWKDFDSFNQNNVKIANKLRNTCLKIFMWNINKSENIIGIGGEYYMYFCNLTYEKYFGFSNNQLVIDDANYNCGLYISNYQNSLVNYNNFTFSKEYYDYAPHNSKEHNEQNKLFDVIINLSVIPNSIIDKLNAQNIKNIVVISCKPIKKYLVKTCVLKYREIFENINGYIHVSWWIPKISL